VRLSSAKKTNEVEGIITVGKGNGCGLMVTLNLDTATSLKSTRNLKGEKLTKTES